MEAITKPRAGQDEALRQVDEDGVEFIRLWFTDIMGHEPRPLVGPDVLADLGHDRLVGLVDDVEGLADGDEPRSARKDPGSCEHSRVRHRPFLSLSAWPAPAWRRGRARPGFAGAAGGAARSVPARRRRRAGAWPGAAAPCWPRRGRNGRTLPLDWTVEHDLSDVGQHALDRLEVQPLAGDVLRLGVLLRARRRSGPRRRWPGARAAPCTPRPRGSSAGPGRAPSAGCPRCRRGPR